MDGIKRVAVLVGGWGDVERCVQHLKTSLEEATLIINQVYYFRYNYAKAPFEWKAFTGIDILADRLATYILDNNLIDQKIQLNLIGYSEGGMLVLYTLGRHPQIRKRVHKIISIAAPHGGALVEQFRDLIAILYQGLKETFHFTGGFLGELSNFFYTMVEQQMQIFGIGNFAQKFLAKDYVDAVMPVFDDIPKDRILEIYSKTDPIVRPESCRRFQEHMQFYQVNYENHQNLANFRPVIDKILEFIGTD